MSPVAIVIEAMIWLLGAYLALGAVAAIALHARGLGVIDPGVAGATRGFRILVTPGLVLLWPVLIRRWARGVQAAPNPELPLRPWKQRAIHGSAWMTLLWLGPVIILGAVLVRPAPPAPARPLPRSAFDDADPATLRTIWTVREVFPDHTGTATLAADPLTHHTLAIHQEAEMVYPSLALYWSGLANASAEHLKTAVWLGMVGRDTVVDVPDTLPVDEGTFLLYSLAGGELIATFAPPGRH